MASTPPPAAFSGVSPDQQGHPNAAAGAGEGSPLLPQATQTAGGSPQVIVNTMQSESVCLACYFVRRWGVLLNQAALQFEAISPQMFPPLHLGGEYLVLQSTNFWFPIPVAAAGRIGLWVAFKSDIEQLARISSNLKSAGGASSSGSPCGAGRRKSKVVLPVEDRCLPIPDNFSDEAVRDVAQYSMISPFSSAVELRVLSQHREDLREGNKRSLSERLLSLLSPQEIAFAQNLCDPQFDVGAAAEAEATIAPPIASAPAGGASSGGPSSAADAVGGTTSTGEQQDEAPATTDPNRGDLGKVSEAEADADEKLGFLSMTKRLADAMVLADFLQYDDMYTFLSAVCATILERSTGNPASMSRLLGLKEGETGEGAMSSDTKVLSTAEKGWANK